MDEYGYDVVDPTERDDFAADRGLSRARALADDGYHLAEGVGFRPDAVPAPHRAARIGRAWGQRTI